MGHAMNESTRFDAFRSLALNEDLAGMGLMLAEGFDVNMPNDAHETALIHCCANNRLRSARFLAGRGANLNLPDAGGGTPMDYALRHASREFQDWLSRAGGRMDRSSGYSRPSAPD
jgi:ankyrin repeat protein